MNECILIVEDDESIRRLIEVAMQGNGYRTEAFDNAISALEFMKTTVPDVAIFDIMMEGLDGLEAVKRMRRTDSLKTVPVIMLTAKDTEVDKVVGLDAGADDYMTKPFSILELCARVRAQLRRADKSSAPGDDEQTVFECGDLKLDDTVHAVTLNGKEIELTLKEYQMLRLLMKNPNKVLSRSEILRSVWGADYCGETRTLDMHIGTLRHKLGD